jgi:hypothetical protein
VSHYLVAIGLILALAFGGILVDRLYRRFAQSHPELGPFRKEGGCGSCAGGKCGSGHCETQGQG